MSKNLKPVNWILIAANLIVAVSPFLTLYSEGVSRLGNARTVILWNDKGPGELLIILAALNILFALLRKKIPVIVFTILMIVLVAIIITGTIESSNYFHVFGFGVGFYMLIAGVILMAASFPISNVLFKRR